MRIDHPGRFRTRPTGGPPGVAPRRIGPVLGAGPCSGNGQRCSGGAFTLIELLLSITIFAVVLTAVNGVFYGAMRLRNKTTQMLEDSVPLERVASVLRRDLSGMVVPGGTLSGNLITTTATTPGMQAGNGFEFYTSSGIVDDKTPFGDVQKVAIALRDPVARTASNGRDLVRLVTRNLLAPTQPLPEEEYLIGGVQQFAFAFYDGQQWRDSWDSSTAEVSLPTAVKVQIDFAPEDILQGGRRAGQQIKPPIQLVVPLLVAGRTNSTDNAGGTQ